MPEMARKKKVNNKLAAIAKGIKLLILDVDGVLTDGRIILDNAGNEYKSFHVRDGHGIKMLIRAGVNVAIITGRSSKVVDIRARELGISEVFQKCKNKAEIYESLCLKYGYKDSEVAFVGDDIVDAPVLGRAGLPVVVADADPEVRRLALFTTERAGGRGAVREVSDLILKAKGLWQGMVDEYFTV
ncbi:MAG: HAD-IIIA family hydrolase [Nitrospiraceae bacterium]|nr:HAD-IIIA family hydrolase [Nitrospiraceae bacterium]